MFTGLVAMMGTVMRLTGEGAGKRLSVAAELLDESITLGESIAVNGVCLTVVDRIPGEATFQLAPETLLRTNLGDLTPGAPVNLERALRLGDRLGGHWVQGHVDGQGTLLRRELEGAWEQFVFQLPEEWCRYLASKGSVTLNGVSLTVVQAERETFSVALIPHTLQITNLGQLQPGARVNVEVDILAKYVERLLTSQTAPGK
jgi:riboflavin synthase